MVEILRPARGGYLRPFGCAEFIMGFLAGRGPDFGVPAIDPFVGAPMVDIFYHYKGALHRAWAEDMVGQEEAKRAARRLPPLTTEEAERLTLAYMGKIPIKFHRARYSSFTRYFDHLKRLNWVEKTDRVEPSGLQDYYPEAPSRVYYRITDTGKAARPLEVMNPLRTLYPKFSKEYSSRKNREHRGRYVKRKP